MLKKSTILVISLTMVLGLAILSATAAEIDFGGKTITIICHWQYLDPESEQAQDLMAKYNIGKINMLTVPWEEIYNTCLSRLLAGDSTYDIWYLGHTFPLPLLKEEALYPVSDILGMEYYESLPPVKRRIADDMTLKRDKRYYMAAGNDAEFGNFVYVYWNKDLFKRQGLASPYELYKAGNWTYSAMEDLAKKATIDEDNDGTIDQWGIARIHHKDWMLTNGGEYVYWEDGKLKLGMGDDVVEALDTLSRWKNVDKILKSANYYEDEAMMTLFFEGKAAMTVASPWEIWPDAMEDAYSMVPLPKGPDAEEYCFYQMTNNGYYLPINSAEPEKMAEFIKALSPIEEYEYYLQNSIQQHVLDEESAEVIMTSLEKFNANSNYEAIFATDEFWVALDDIVAGTKTAATALNEIKPIIQANIDEYNKYLEK